MSQIGFRFSFFKGS